MTRLLHLLCWACVSGLMLPAVALAAAAPHAVAPYAAASNAAVSLPRQRNGQDALDSASRQAVANPAGAVARLIELSHQGSAAQRALAAWALAGAYSALSDDAAAAALVWRLERSASPFDRSVAGLVRAAAARDAGVPDMALRHALHAVQQLDQALSGITPGLPEDSLRAEALRLLGAVMGSTGQVAEGLRHLQSSRRLAQALRDNRREARAWHEEADVLAQYGQAERAQAAEAEAWQAAQALVPTDPALLAVVQTGVARRALAASRDANALNSALANARADALTNARSAARLALAWARTAAAPALQAQALLLLSQTERLAGDGSAALGSARAAHTALAGLPEHAALKRMALAQVGLAHIACGRVVQGRQAVEAVLARQSGAQAWASTFPTTGPVDGANEASAANAPTAATTSTTSTTSSIDPLAPDVLRQLDQALHAASEPRAALEVFHRERALHQARIEQERSVVLRDLQTRHDRDRQQRELDTLNRSNALKAAAFEQRAQMQHGLWAAALLVTLGMGIMVTLYSRLRGLRQRLAASQTQLKEFSERDALTGLANRRHGQAVIASSGLTAEFAGALLLLDVDHFKRINDQHGHAVGDAVLVEVARRLRSAAREGDLVVRWGGEEFLLASLGAAAAQVGPLAERLRQAVAGAPIASQAGPLSVTVSIGCASFPLPGEPAMGWDQAVDRVDAALYLAKAAGRNRACAVQPRGAGVNSEPSPHGQSCTAA
jgi:diguanylate cyclase (GGDEF)-like protein